MAEDLRMALQELLRKAELDEDVDRSKPCGHSSLLSRGAINVS